MRSLLCAVAILFFLSDEAKCLRVRALSYKNTYKYFGIQNFPFLVRANYEEVNYENSEKFSDWSESKCIFFLLEIELLKI